MGPFRFLRRELQADMGEVESVGQELRNLLVTGAKLDGREAFALELLARERGDNQGQ